MNLENVFDQLSAGELSQFDLGGLNEGGIDPADYYKIIPLVNLGIVELHKRFRLMACEVTVALKNGKTRYRLDSSNSHLLDTGEKFIIDSPHAPFEDNIIEITAVHNEVGEELYLNYNDSAWSVFTPEYNLLEHPYPDSNNAVSVSYYGYPKEIAKDITDPASVNIHIPPIFLEALVLYVGSRLYSGLSVDGDNGNTRAYTQRFENSCAQLKRLHTTGGTANEINTRLEKAGWV